MNNKIKIWSKEELLNNKDVEHREIQGYPGYIASYDGEIFSCRLGKNKGYRKLKLIYCKRTNTLSVTLNYNSKGKTFRLHKLLGIAFFGPPPEFHDIFHKDGNTLNNNVSNLYYDYSIFKKETILYSSEDLFNSTIQHKEIPNFPGYVVNTKGEVFSSRFCLGKTGKYKKLVPGKTKGRARFSLRRFDGKFINYCLHQIIANTFLGPCPQGMLVCHNNGNEYDDRLDNLRYDTPSNNSKDMIKHKSLPNTKAKLSRKQVKEIRELITSGLSSNKIAARYNVGTTCISRIKRNEVWRNIIMKNGWLVNDRLTCIPNTKTFWHNLLDNFPYLKDMCNSYTPFEILADYIEESVKRDEPEYIIRNASYFRKMDLPPRIKIISLLQDIKLEDKMQHEVLNSSDLVVCNSNHTRDLYKDIIKVKSVVVPLGVDETFFTPSDDYSQELGILKDSILFVGAANSYPKGFETIVDLIEKTNYNFTLVMKDDYSINHPRVKVFNRVSQATIKKIYNSCKILICTSKEESEYMVGIEAGLCDLPAVVTNVGIYKSFSEEGLWGVKVLDTQSFISKINYVIGKYSIFKPHNYYIKSEYTNKACMNKWEDLIMEI